jgi:hypothetical protein
MIYGLAGEQLLRTLRSQVTLYATIPYGDPNCPHRAGCMLTAIAAAAALVWTLAKLTVPPCALPPTEGLHHLSGGPPAVTGQQRPLM